ncbi:MAG: hypothetical protein IJ061_08700, partial [Lachnospiraceae bacterium]|nr:hypothetical protein [Lachnospiraceae bacterium]
AEKERLELERLEKERLEKEKEPVEFKESKEIDGVLITVTAPAGVFPRGSVLSVQKVKSTRQIEQIDDSIREVKDSDRSSSESEKEANVSDQYVYDIKVMYEGREIQPNTEYGEVSVSFTLRKSFKEEEQVDVYHVSRADSGEHADADGSGMTIYEEETTASSEAGNADGTAGSGTETAGAGTETAGSGSEAGTGIGTPVSDENQALSAEKVEVSVEQGVIPEAAADTSFGKKAAEEIDRKESNGETADITTISVTTSSFSFFVLQVSTLEKILTASDGNTYKVTLTYDADAQIPADAELEVTELVDEDAAEYREWTAEALQWTENDHVFYSRFFDIRILSGGEVIEPAAPVSVTVELLDMDQEHPDLDGLELAEMLQVVHFGRDDASMSAQELEASAFTGDQGYDISFETHDSPVCAIGGIAKPLISWSGNDVDVTVKGLSGRQDPGYTQNTELGGLEEGLELIDAYSISGSTASDTEPTMWAHIKTNREEELNTRESLDLYSITGGELGEVVSGQVKAGDEIALPLDDTINGFAFVKDTGLRRQEVELEPAEGKIVRLDGMMPKDAEVSAQDVTETYAGVRFGSTEAEKQSEDYCYRDSDKAQHMLAAFDISIVRDGEKFQPGEEKPVNVEITMDAVFRAGRAGRDLEIWHIADDGTEEQIVDYSVDESTLRFAASGFSAYAIIQKEEISPIGWEKIHNLEDLATIGRDGVYIGHPDGYYFKNTMTKDSRRTGITKTKPAAGVPTSEAALYHFEQAGDGGDSFYVYCMKGNEKLYVRNAGDNSLSLVSESGRTAFTVSVLGDGVFTLSNGSWFWNMQGGANGARFCSYNSEGDPNNRLCFWYYMSPESDPYGYDGQTYGLMNWEGGTAGKALMAETVNGSRLQALPLTVMTKKGDIDDQLFVPNDSDISMWTFSWISHNLYSVTAETGEGTVYLKLNTNGVSLASEPDDDCRIQLVPGTGSRAGQICLRTGDTVLAYSGNVDEGFTAGGSAGTEWLNLTGVSELTSDYFMTYSASKVSISDKNIQEGSKIIVYARAWNDKKKKYEFYAIDHDGSLVPCYESGDSIQWIGGRL